MGLVLMSKIRDGKVSLTGLLLSSVGTPSSTPTTPIATEPSVNWGWSTITFDPSPLQYLASPSPGTGRSKRAKRWNQKATKKDMQRQAREQELRLLSLYSESSDAYDSSSASSWEKIAGNSQITVSLLDSIYPPTIKVVLDILAPIEYVEFYLDPDHWSKTQHIQDPFFANWEVLHDLGPISPRSSKSPPVSISIGRRTTKRLLTFGRRDLVFACFKESLPSLNATRFAALSISHPSHPLVNPSTPYTRAFQDLIITASALSASVTHVECFMKVDLGGNIPKWVFRKTVGQTGLMAFKAISKKAVESFAKGRMIT
ncbi:hypothetical protein TrCOL_g11176 [Triparma columacea]|uniref:START domain-containing protein n=1 Tax=Triparma columacea TaxID=722753 RepID=A0A9W7LE79_9STRA|nr:hypothetical protein TrCOL_g11176 [Triparma columacea]